MAAMRRGFRTPLLGLAAVAIMSPLAAQDEEELTWYAMELIVFERVSEAARHVEAWPRQPGLPDLADAVELSRDGLAPAEAEEGQSSDPQSEPLPTAQAALRAFRLLPPEEYRLGDAWNRLDASKAYRPLLHVAWIQPGFPSEDARLVHLRNDNAALGSVGSVSVDGDQEAPALEPTSSFTGFAPSLSPQPSVARDPSAVALDGTVRVHRARYLHVQVDLLYYRPTHGGIDTMETPADDANTGTIADSPDIAFTEQLLAEYDADTTLFRLTESRRMRSKELHYLDHPLFGVLVEAWPLELPETPLEVLPADQGDGSETSTGSQGASGG